ncbi:uncharacterized protein [Anabrus simplex]|uniref:uncharacterized protein n=1 Tax=Anabrus simplex TaxID=316456 RepID=UPI0035A2CC75
MGQETKLLSLLFLSLALGDVCFGKLLPEHSAPASTSSLESNDVDSAIKVSEPSSWTNNFNDTVDLILQVLQETLKKSNHTTIPIPDIEEQFIKKMRFIKIKGKLTARKGWFKDLSTVYRTGDAKIVRSGPNITISVSVGLGLLQLGYDYVHVKVEALSATGNLTAKVSTNSVFIQVNVVMSDTGKCNLTLQELEVTQLDELQVHVEGFKKTFDWLLSEIITIVSRRFKEKILKEVEKDVIVAAQEAMDNFHC